MRPSSAGSRRRAAGSRAQCDALGVIVLIKPATVDVLVRHCQVVASRGC